MRNFIFLLAIFTSLTSCLNNDVLDKDLDNSNFKESSFYTSGDFDRLFGFTVVSTDFKTITSPLGDTLCEPRYTLQLNETFANRLAEEWSNQIIITLFKEQTTLPEKGIDFVFSKNYNQEFIFTGKAIDCSATTSDLQASLVLVAPNTGRATASIDRKTIYITFTL